MSKKLIFLTSYVLLLGLVTSVAEGADPNLVGWWKFDEGSGTTANDSSGNENHGAFKGDPQWVNGKFGKALKFDGSSDYLAVPDSDSLDINGDQLSIVAWINGESWSLAKHIVRKIADEAASPIYVFRVQPDQVRAILSTSAGNTTIQGATVLPTNEWIHVALAYDGGEARIYVNGELDASSNVSGEITQSNNELRIGLGDPAGYFHGTIDDVRIHNKALTQEGIQAIIQGVGMPYAFDSSPADGAILEATWANLSWKAGYRAVSHDVYLGDNFDDVNDGTGNTFLGNQAGTTLIVGFPGFAYPGGLVLGTTYYWRVDEVNDADPNSPWKGEVWSFTVPSETAYNPLPADGCKYIDPNVEINWTAGMKAKLHTVYFGDNFDDVNSAVEGASQTNATYTPAGPLELGKTYYWRVDEFDGMTMRTGDVWSFKTRPVIPITDPNLVGRWTLDEGMGSTAVDWSGHGNHGTLFGPDWITPGWLGDAALDFRSSGYVAIQNLSYDRADYSEVTVCVWIRTKIWNQQDIASFDRDQYWFLGISRHGVGPGQVGWHVMTSSGQIDCGSTTRVDDGLWHHVCGVFDKGLMTIYIDGWPEPSVSGGTTFGTGNTRFGFLGAVSEATSFNGDQGSGRPVVGDMDDFRIYDRALTQDEIVLVMRGDPQLAWNPNPAEGSTPDIDNAMPLSWSAGDDASSHEVYFGTDADAVKNADTSDTTGICRGRQNGTSFTPAEGVEWGGGPFYWRVDENNADGTVTKGRLWNFTVADFILVDDFESYTDNDAANEAVWQHWIDGYEAPTNGSQVGNLMPPYAEQTIVHGGGQSMPLAYNNTGGVTNSEAVFTLTAPRDWTRHDVGILSLWFRGYPPSVGGFTEGPAGTFTMTAAGADISGAADEFHFAYRTLTGQGTIIARIDSIVDTNPWAKAGVMIRETLNADSKHAFVCVTPGNGVASEGRTDTANTSFSTNQTPITAPHWVRLERDAAGNFTASHSTNGSTWEPVSGSIPTNIPMESNVYVGLAVTSHDDAATTQARFSNVTITGSAFGQWTHRDIGIMSNNAEPLYVALSNNTGAPAVIVHDDANASVTDVWTQWKIDLSKFADQGVNLSDVDKLAIGLGATGDPVATGGSGTMFIDDIMLLRPDSQ